MKWVGIWAAVFLSAQGVWGASFSMDPWIIILEPQNQKISQIITFKYLSGNSANNGSVQGPMPSDDNSPVPAEISIMAREVTLDGKVVYPSSQGADDFVVYPAQFILYPGDTKKVQLQWVGTALPTKEIAYGLIATQLPIDVRAQKDLKQAEAIVQVVTRYEGIVVVRPNGVRPSVAVDTAYAKYDSTGTHMALILNNKGTGMQSLKQMEVSAAPLDQHGNMDLGKACHFMPNIDPEDLKKSVFAGYRRRILIPWPKQLPVTPVKVTVTFPENAK